MLRALRNTGIVVIYQAPDMRVRWAQNVPAGWGTDTDIVGKTDAEFLSGPGTGRVIELKHAVLASGVQETLEFRDSVDAGGRWYDMWIDADREDDGAISGVVTTIVEITERKRREQTLQTLLREVSHRSKNLLAIIQSIATQTGRYSSNIDTFLSRFRGRLQSLASSQDLVTMSNWRGAMLRELVDGQIARFREEADGSVEFRGEDVYLNPNAALHIGLALHELVVNSMSHGALAHPQGRVALTSEIVGRDGGPESSFEPSLVLTWSERTDAHDLREARRFGRVALERVVPSALDGTAVFNVGDDHLSYRLEVPAGNFESE